MSFRLVPKSVTLNDLERRNGVILRCFSEFGYLQGALRKSSRSLSHLLMSSCVTMSSVLDWMEKPMCVWTGPLSDVWRLFHAKFHIHRCRSGDVGPQNGKYWEIL